MARFTASVQLATPSLVRIVLAWDLMAEGETVSLAAIWSLVRPSTNRTSTSRSRTIRLKPGSGGFAKLEGVGSSQPTVSGSAQ
jgi:hypothetical protein